MKNARKSLRKKSLALLCVMTMFVTVTPPMEAVAAELVASGNCGDNITWSLDDSGLFKIEGTGAVEDRVPLLLDWDDNIYSKISSAIIGEGVTDIPSGTFEYCENLRTVSLPSSLKKIGSSAFEECSNLSSVNLPAGIKTIEYATFVWCEKLTSIDIPNSVTSIDEEAFRGAGLTSIDIPTSVTRIGEYAFADTKIKKVDIPASVADIGDDAFDNFVEYSNTLTDINIASGNTKYASSDGALLNKAKTELIFCPDAKTSYSIPNTVEIIRDNAFDDGKLSSIIIPDGVTTIGKRAFANCSSLEGISFPSSVTSIGDFAFRSCGSLKNITFPSSVTSIAYGTMADCGRLTSVTIPSSVTSIDKYAFSGCQSLTGITVPSSVTDIHETAFIDCSNLTTIYGVAGSYAEIFAKNKGLKFVAQGVEETASQTKLTKASLSASSYTFNGKVKKPAVTVKAGSLTVANKITKDTSNIDLTYASGRKNVGTYKVTIKGKGNYTGTITKSFKINPKGVGISKLSNGKKAFTVKWKKPSSANRKQMTGYQIRYSTSSKMTKAKTVTVKSTKATSKKIGKLKAKKKYYVQMRTYKTVKGKKYYSGWSKTKSVKTK